MASAVLLDFDALLRPISDELPAGPNLRDDVTPASLYQQIKDARATARAAERSAVFDPEASASAAGEWQPILEFAPDFIGTRAKDLEIVAWWIEALLRNQGFAGLRDGIRLARELVDRYWDGLHPMPDEDGVATRVRPLAGLNGLDSEGTLLAPLLMVPITQPNGDAGPFAAWHYQQARDLSRIEDPDKRSEREQAGAVSMDTFMSAINASDPHFLADTLADIRACISEWAALGNSLDGRCGADSPPQAAIRDALTGAADTLQFAAKDRLPLAEEAPAEGEAGESGAGAGGGRKKNSSGSIETREDAFRALRSVADFFRRSEPHSPIPFALEQAVRWGQMPLPQLLRELIPDDGARHNFFKLTGIPEEPPS